MLDNKDVAERAEVEDSVGCPIIVSVCPPNLTRIGGGISVMWLP